MIKSYFGFYKIIGYQFGENINYIYPTLKWVWYPFHIKHVIRLLSDVCKGKIQKIYIPTPYPREFKLGDKVEINISEYNITFTGIISKIDLNGMYYHVNNGSSTFYIVKKNHLKFLK